MHISKLVMLVFFLGILGPESFAQTIKQLNGLFNITSAKSLSGQYQIAGQFSDPSNLFSAGNIIVGDQIVDKYGNAFSIVTITSVAGSTVNVIAEPLNSADPGLGKGILFRPTANGYPLLAQNTPDAVLNTVVNTSTVSISTDLPKFESGSNLPVNSYTPGSVVQNSTDLNFYVLETTDWRQLTVTPSSSFSTSITAVPVAPSGSIVYLRRVGSYYYSDGSSWSAIPTVSSLPSIPKYGDVFYETSTKTLYMAFNDGSGKIGWTAISSSAVSSGGSGTFPSEPKPGMLYFNSDNNTLYLFDNTLTWVEVSTNGSTPGELGLPDPSSGGLKEGRLFYNQSEHQLYVFDGTAWLPLGNRLNDGYIYVGNSSSVATGVRMSGDATLSNSGRVTINNLAITEDKLDKQNIPLSGFGLPKANISMGDGTTNYRITNLLTPSTPQDAATKGYVDNLFSNPSANLSLPNNNFFVGNALNRATPVAKINIPLSGFGNPISNVSMGGKQISNLGSPSVGTDAANKDYVDSRQVYPIDIGLGYNMLLQGNVQDRAAMVEKKSIPFSDFGAAIADVPFGGFKATDLSDPLALQDAATKNYVDKRVMDPMNISLGSGRLLIGNSSDKASPVLKNVIPLSGFGSAVADISLGTFKITELGAPVNDSDATNKKYVDDLFLAPSSLLTLPNGNFFVGNSLGKAAYATKNSIAISGFGKATANVYMGDASNKYNISHLADPTEPDDAATKIYVDQKVSNPSSLTLSSGSILVGNASNVAESVPTNFIPISQFGIATQDISLGTNKIVNLADPSADQEAATKKYVDGKTGSVPSGTTPPANPVAGSTYYNTTEKTFYVYDGSQWVPVDNKLAKDQFYVGDASNKAVATVKSAIPLSGFGAATADINLGSHKISNLADPSADQEAATKKYVDGKTGSVPSATTPPANPVAGSTYYNTTDKTFYVYDGSQWVPVDNKLAKDQFYVGDVNNKAVATAKNTIPLSGFAAATADIDLGSKKISNLADPSTDQEAATKKYVDGKAGSVPSGPTPPASPTVGSTYYNTTTKTFMVYDGSQWVPVDNGNALSQGHFLVGDASNKAVATAKADIPLSGFGAPATDLSIGGKRLLDVATPILPTDGANKTYVDVLVSTVGGNYMTKSVYDANSNNKVDDADKVNGLTVETAVPVNAIFTDDKVRVGASGASKYLSSTDFDDSGSDISIKSLTLSKIAPVAANSIIGNNTAVASAPKELSADEVKALLALNNVDNTKDATKNVYSATRLTTPITINGVPFDGSSNISVPGDNLGNHTATQNLKTLTYSISSDGQDGRGLSFESSGSAILAQDLTVKGNLYTPSDLRLKTKIETLGNVLQSLEKMRGVRFEYKDQKKYAKGPKIGVIAQELKKYYPEMVTIGADGFYKVDYSQLTGVLIQAVKEQQLKMKLQQQEIVELQMRLDKQQQQIDSILKKLDN